MCSWASLENIWVAPQCWASLSSIISHRPHHLDPLLPHKDFLVHTVLRLISESCSCWLNFPSVLKLALPAPAWPRALQWASKLLLPHSRLGHYSGNLCAPQFVRLYFGKSQKSQVPSHSTSSLKSRLLGDFFLMFIYACTIENLENILNERRK